MANKKKISDDIRLKVMEALFETGALTPNINKIHEITGLHKNTIINSLEYLRDEGVLKEYTPNFDLAKLGFNAHPLLIYEFDKTLPTDLVKTELEKGNKDPHIYKTQALSGHEKFNQVAFALFKSLDEYHEYTEQQYYSKNKNLNQYIKNIMQFYLCSNTHKDLNVNKAAIQILKSESNRESS